MDSQMVQNKREKQDKAKRKCYANFHIKFFYIKKRLILQVFAVKNIYLTSPGFLFFTFQCLWNHHFFGRKKSIIFFKGEKNIYEKKKANKQKLAINKRRKLNSNRIRKKKREGSGSLSELDENMI